MNKCRSSNWEKIWWTDSIAIEFSYEEDLEALGRVFSNAENFEDNLRTFRGQEPLDNDKITADYLAGKLSSGKLHKPYNLEQLAPDADYDICNT